MEVHPPAAVATKLRKVHVDKFDTSSMQWNCWREQFELQIARGKYVRVGGDNLAFYLHGQKLTQSILDLE